VRFAGVDAHPRPLQQPHPPIVVGGTSPPALHRALTKGNGWYGFLRDLDATKADLAGLEAARRGAARPAALGALEISITPPPRLDLDGARRYQDLGVDRLVLLPHARDEGTLLRWVDETAEALLRKLA
jgi:alkanesulfonate monooxygenase SsuD/methylene tetrahydromethanopterin reductase-like flavin-dependent oxidoreductase (luciferase family)